MLTLTSTFALTPANRQRFHKLFRWQARVAMAFDNLLAADYRVDGNRDFIDDLVPRYLSSGAVVYDVGGGKNPLIGLPQKTELGLTVAGMDIDREQLTAAPEGCYDEIVCCDISHYSGKADADLVICQALLEHVADTDGALKSIASILKPGGRALIFVPSRNAAYARLNLLLPESLKRSLLYFVFPEMRRDHGFPAYYDRCTPKGIEKSALAHGLTVEHRRLYFYSTYFSFCLPLHVLWRLWMLIFRAIAGPQAAETFSVVLYKPKESACS
jgi:2-polyprenyl-6-hydroxyphenyl methylase/3-demethylubiquinone-9 3-methyltransferase